MQGICEACATKFANRKVDWQDTSSKHKSNEVEDESATASAGSVYKFIEPEDTDLTALAHFSEITTFNSLMKNGNVESFMQNSLGQFQFKPKNFFPASQIKVQLCSPQRLLIS